MALGAKPAKRSPPHPQIKVPEDAKQQSISQFFKGQTVISDRQNAACPNSPQLPKHAETHHPPIQVTEQQSPTIGEHPKGAMDGILGNLRSPPPTGARQRGQKAADRGKKNLDTLQSWRVPGAISSEPGARALMLHNPHNLCYANSVLHMLHYARSHEGQVSGLGAMCGALTQAARSSRATNVARGTDWAFMWHGWRQPTHQHDRCGRVSAASLPKNGLLGTQRGLGGLEAQRRNVRYY